MDPDAALELIRQNLETDDLESAAVLFVDLDKWLSRGGFLPTDWNANR